MVDTRDLKSLAGFLRTGSSPVTGTNEKDSLGCLFSFLAGLPVRSPAEALSLCPDCVFLCVLDPERAGQMESQLRSLCYAGEIIIEYLPRKGFFHGRYFYKTQSGVKTLTLSSKILLCFVLTP